MDRQIWSCLYISSRYCNAQPNSFGEGFLQEVFLMFVKVISLVLFLKSCMESG